VITYIIRRLLYSIPVLLAASFLIFSLISLSSDPLAQLRANPKFSPDTLAHLRVHFNLDKPIPVRYVYWLKDFVLHKGGDSLLTNHPIWPDIQRVMGHTAQLVLISEGLAILLGVAIGVYSAVRQYSFFDYTFTTLSFLGFAMPVFLLALLLQIAFTDIYLHWHIRIFYTSGLNSPGQGTWSIDRLQHLALPIVTLCVISFALYSRFMRASMLDVINSDYARTARAKGVPEWRVIMRHVFRNALIPLVTVIALNIGAVLGGAIITESVFSLDGMGFYFIDRLNHDDLYAVMGWLVLTSIFVILFNLIADVLYGFLDPRIRYA
jgi:peptide/nickel transport system permease protein